MLLDVYAGDLPEFRNIFIYGVLELPYESVNDFRLTVRSIHVIGGRLIVGWPDDRDPLVTASLEPRRMQSDVEIQLKAAPTDAEVRSTTISVGPKGIGTSCYAVCAIIYVMCYCDNMYFF